MLGGREAAHAAEEPKYDPDRDSAPIPGPAVANPPKDGASHGTAAGAGHITYQPGVHGCVTDTMGRKHSVDVYG